MNEDVAAIYHIYIKWIEKIHLVCCPLNIKTMFKSSTTLMRSKVLMTHVTNPTALGERKGTAAYQIPCVCVAQFTSERQGGSRRPAVLHGNNTVV